MELSGQGIDVDAGFGEPGEHLLAVPTVRGENAFDLTMFSQSVQRALGHGVHGERGGESLDVEEIGCRGVLGSSAGPQKALRAGAGAENPLPKRGVDQGAIRLVGALSLQERRRHLAPRP